MAMLVQASLSYLDHYITVKGHNSHVAITSCTDKCVYMPITRLLGEW